MTLSEIEILLEDLIARHNDLDTELLTTILLAAGLDSKTIKEVTFIFKQKKETKEPKRKEKDFEVIGSNESPTEKELDSLKIETVSKENLHLLKQGSQSSISQTSYSNSPSFFGSLVSLFFW